MAIRIMAAMEISTPLNGRYKILEDSPKRAANPIPQDAQPGARIPRNKPIEARKLNFSVCIFLAYLYL